MGAGGGENFVLILGNFDPHGVIFLRYSEETRDFVVVEWASLL